MNAAHKTIALELAAVPPALAAYDAVNAYDALIDGADGAYEADVAKLEYDEVADAEAYDADVDVEAYDADDATKEYEEDKDEDAHEALTAVVDATAGAHEAETANEDVITFSAHDAVPNTEAVTLLALMFPWTCNFAWGETLLAIPTPTLALVGYSCKICVPPDGSPVPINSFPEIEPPQASSVAAKNTSAPPADPFVILNVAL